MNTFFYSAEILKIFSDEIDCKLIEQLPEEFFKTISGFEYKWKIEIKNESELLNLYLLVFFLRSSGGIDITIKMSEGNLFLINSDIQQPLQNNKLKTSYGVLYENKTLKNSFLNELKNIERNDQKTVIGNLCILTCNRPEVFKETLNQYIENIHFYGHDINIMISDDSDENNALKNQKIVDDLIKDFPHITYLNRFKKSEIINQITNDIIKSNSHINTKKIEYYISYTFGGKNFQPSYGRNRNFVSWYFGKKPYISVDDDSRPFVLTYSHHDLKNSFLKMIKNGVYDFERVNEYIYGDKNRLLRVNFAGAFYLSSNSQYVYYSGSRDMESYYRYLKHLIYEDSEIIEKMPEEKGLKKMVKELNERVFVFNEKNSKEKMIRGLACYFPKNTEKMRVTIPENLRLEDFFMGLNYSYIYGVNPDETLFSLFHTKNYDEKITILNIHLEIISNLIMVIYTEIQKKYSYDDFINEFLKITERGIRIHPDMFEILKKHKIKVLNLYQSIINDFPEKTLLL